MTGSDRDQGWGASGPMLWRRSRGQFQTIGASDAAVAAPAVWDRILQRPLTLDAVRSVGADAGPRRAELVHHARVLARFEHPGLPVVHELGEDDALGTYAVTQAETGQALATLLETPDGGPQALLRWIELLARAAEAVVHAHARGVAHGALSAETIRVGAFGAVRVVDWQHATVVSVARAANVERDVEALGAILAAILARPACARHPQRGELHAVAQRATSPTARRYYRSARDLLNDLRAWLDGRVVVARSGGALYVLRKWAARNRALALALLGASVVAAAGAAALGLVQRTANAALVEANGKLRRAEREARTEAERARRSQDEILGLADARLLAELIARADQLEPALPGHLDARDAWLRDADALVARLPQHRRLLATVRARAIPERDEPAAAVAAAAKQRERAAVEVELAALVDRATVDVDGLTPWSRVNELVRRLQDLPAPSAPSGPRFADPADAWLHEVLHHLVEDLAGFADVAGGTLGAVRQQRSAATLIAETTGERAIALWRQAIAEIADPDVCPAYRGLTLRPQLGMVPLRRDARSGLWEFAHVASGVPPRSFPGPAGGDLYVLWEPMSLVFVLLPGGLVRLRADSNDRVPEYLDPAASRGEAPVQEVELAPFFCSKYEMTVAQWQRLSFMPRGEPPTTAVETVSYHDAERVLWRVGLELPTEAQWEYAARGGTTTVWWCGDDRTLLATCANLADQTLKPRAAQAWFPFAPWADGHAGIAPVDTMQPNPFGLHHVHGNVAEWCRDTWDSYRLHHRAGDGLRVDSGDDRRVVRGGGWLDGPESARSAFRHCRPPDYAHVWLGVRPVRRIE